GWYMVDLPTFSITPFLFCTTNWIVCVCIILKPPYLLLSSALVAWNTLKYIRLHYSGGLWGVASPLSWYAI
ncbi:MAG: hypothetical protein ACOCM4_14020, partial [Acetivibrio ethanolgignens]